jgi:hypothetical protein
MNEIRKKKKKKKRKGGFKIQVKAKGRMTN